MDLKEGEKSLGTLFDLTPSKSDCCESRMGLERFLQKKLLELDIERKFFTFKRLKVLFLFLFFLKKRLSGRRAQCPSLLPTRHVSGTDQEGRSPVWATGCLRDRGLV